MKNILLLLCIFFGLFSKTFAQSSEFLMAAKSARCLANFTSCPERKAYMIKLAEQQECRAEMLKTGSQLTNEDCDKRGPLSNNAPNCPEDAGKSTEDVQRYLANCMNGNSTSIPLSNGSSNSSTIGGTNSTMYNMLDDGQKKTVDNVIKTDALLGAIGANNNTRAIGAGVGVFLGLLNSDKQKEQQKQQEEEERENQERQEYLRRVQAENAEQERIKQEKLELIRREQEKFDNGIKYAKEAGKDFIAPKVTLDQTIKSLYFFSYFVNEKTLWTSESPFVINRYADQTWKYGVDIMNEIKDILNVKYNISPNNITLSGYYTSNEMANSALNDMKNRAEQYGIQKSTFTYGVTPSKVSTLASTNSTNDFWGEKPNKVNNQNTTTNTDFWGEKKTTSLPKDECRTIEEEATITIMGNDRLFLNADVIAITCNADGTSANSGTYVKFENYGKTSFYYKALPSSTYESFAKKTIFKCTSSNIFYEEVPAGTTKIVNVIDYKYRKEENMPTYAEFGVKYCQPSNKPSKEDLLNLEKRKAGLVNGMNAENEITFDYENRSLFDSEKYAFIYLGCSDKKEYYVTEVFKYNDKVGSQKISEKETSKSYKDELLNKFYTTVNSRLGMNCEYFTLLKDKNDCGCWLFLEKGERGLSQNEATELRNGMTNPLERAKIPVNNVKVIFKK